MIFFPLILRFSHFQRKINFGSRDGKRHINDEIEKSLILFVAGLSTF